MMALLLVATLSVIGIIESRPFYVRSKVVTFNFDIMDYKDICTPKMEVFDLSKQETHSFLLYASKQSSATLISKKYLKN